ncbi:hypothetical protein DFH27DRAFT_599966 [Peziza echinospora]|nr:hypothetical protein DFH27DRAFT_599966 [Peziza echinospora]
MCHTRTMCHDMQEDAEDMQWWYAGGKRLLRGGSLVPRGGRNLPLQIEKEQRGIRPPDQEEAQGMSMGTRLISNINPMSAQKPPRTSSGELNEFDRGQIIGMWRKEASLQEIALEIGCEKSTVSRIIQAYKLRGSKAEYAIKHSGRPHLLLL